MIGEGFLIRLAETLGIPLGAKRSPAKNSLSKDSNESTYSDINERLASIADITKDDVCLTNEPFYYKSKRLRLGKQLKTRVDTLTSLFNTISRQVAFDLLTRGYSVYKLCSKDDRFWFQPVLGELNFYLKDGLIVVEDDGKYVDDLLIFVNYDNRDISNSDYNDVYKVTPVGVQARYTKKVIQAIEDAEASLKRLRAQMRYIRFATVEVGVNSGDKQQELVDDIAEGFNANSSSLSQTESFDDEITVYPVRKGLGKPEVSEFAPNTDIGNLTDLEYYNTQLNQYTRFPKSYSDFSQNLSATALSLLRGDIRYERLVTYVQFLMERGVNNFLNPVSVVKKAGIVFYMRKISSSENVDTLDGLQTSTSLISDILQILESPTLDEALSKLNVLISVLTSFHDTAFVSEVRDSLHKYLIVKFSTASDFNDSYSYSDLDSRDNSFSESPDESPDESPETVIENYEESSE